LDPFTITTSTGFLPYCTAPATLPDAFKPLTALLDRMPVVREDGTPGLLAKYELGPVVETELPDLTDEVDKLVTADGSPDLYTVAAVFRDYSFLASAYLLEPCWENWCKAPENGYGLGRDKLPKAVARPMYHCAQLYVFLCFFPLCYITDTLVQVGHPSIHVLCCCLFALQLPPCGPIQGLGV
jgi:indoleamine 2,3-dioxygenase